MVQQSRFLTLTLALALSVDAFAGHPHKRGAHFGRRQLQSVASDGISSTMTEAAPMASDLTSMPADDMPAATTMDEMAASSTAYMSPDLPSMASGAAYMSSELPTMIASDGSAMSTDTDPAAMDPSPDPMPSSTDAGMAPAMTSDGGMAMSTTAMGTDASSLVVIPMTLPSDASIVPFTSTMAYSSIMPTTPSMLPTSSQPPPSGMYHGQPVTYDGQSYKLLQVDVSVFVAIESEAWNDSYKAQGNYPWKSDSSSDGYQSESSSPWKFGSSSSGHHTHSQQSRGLNNACQSTLSCTEKSSHEHDLDLFEVTPAYFHAFAKAATSANQDLLEYANQHPIFIANLGTKETPIAVAGGLKSLNNGLAQKCNSPHQQHLPKSSTRQGMQSSTMASSTLASSTMASSNMASSTMASSTMASQSPMSATSLAATSGMKSKRMLGRQDSKPQQPKHSSSSLSPIAKQNQDTAEALIALVRNDNQTTGLQRATISVNVKLGTSPGDDAASMGQIQMTILKDVKDVKFCVPDQTGGQDGVVTSMASLAAASTTTGLMMSEASSATTTMVAPSSMAGLPKSEGSIAVTSMQGPSTMTSVLMSGVSLPATSMPDVPATSPSGADTPPTPVTTTTLITKTSMAQTVTSTLDE